MIPGSKKKKEITLPVWLREFIVQGKKTFSDETKKPINWLYSLNEDAHAIFTLLDKNNKVSWGVSDKESNEVFLLDDLLIPEVTTVKCINEKFEEADYVGGLFLPAGMRIHVLNSMMEIARKQVKEKIPLTNIVYSVAEDYLISRFTHPIENTHSANMANKLIDIHKDIYEHRLTYRLYLYAHIRLY